MRGLLRAPPSFVLLGVCALGACHLLLPYEPRGDGGAVSRDGGRGDGAAVESGLVLIDSRLRDADDADGADSDQRVRIVDAGAACLTDVAPWAESCRRAAHPNSCAIGCSGYTVVCIAGSCTCAVTTGDSHVCTGITGTAASCEPASSCFQAVSTGCCDRL